MEKLLTVVELAESLKVSRAKVFQLLKDGMPVYRVDSSPRFILREVLVWLRERQQEKARREAE